jgi:hypothetical protein
MRKKLASGVGLLRGTRCSQDCSGLTSSETDTRTPIFVSGMFGAYGLTRVDVTVLVTGP